MYAESRPKSVNLIAAERRLRDLFAAKPPSESEVRAAVVDAESARAEVRLVHLAYHLKMRDALTAAQLRAYHEARWPAAAR
jgi:Spy/CpxP family protein refolding chaperone